MGLRGKKVTGGWRKLYNEQLHDLYCMQYISRMIKEDEMGVHNGEKRNVCRVLSRTCERKGQLGTSSHR